MRGHLKVTDGLLAGHLASRIDVRCPHGSSSSYVLLGTDPADNLAALALVRLRCTMRQSCACDIVDPDQAGPGSSGRKSVHRGN
jgi:hypothetical protein